MKGRNFGQNRVFSRFLDKKINQKIQLPPACLKKRRFFRPQNHVPYMTWKYPPLIWSIFPPLKREILYKMKMKTGNFFWKKIVFFDWVFPRDLVHKCQKKDNFTFDFERVLVHTHTDSKAYFLMKDFSNKNFKTPTWGP